MMYQILNKPKNHGPSFGLSYSSFEKVYIQTNKIPLDKSLPGPGTYKVPTYTGKQYSIGARPNVQNNIIDKTKNCKMSVCNI